MHPPHDLDLDLLPWSNEAECSVLGSLLLDNESWDRVGDLLLDRHFYDHRHGLIFTAIGSLVNAGKPADIITVFNHIAGTGNADSVGGLVYLNQLAQYIPSANNARRYAEIVAERALMRGMIEGAEKVKALATKPGMPVSQRLDEAQGVLQALQVNNGRVMPTSIEASVSGLLDRIQSAADGTTLIGLSTGISGMNRMFGGGLKAGKQIIIAARPSVGKSSLAQQISLSLALDGHPVGFFSQEMSKDELTDRAVANLARIDLDNIISGQMSDPDWARLTEGIERMRGLPLYLDDQPALTLHDIAAKARMLKRQHDVRVIVVDYIQLCSSSGKTTDDSRHHQIEALSRGLKNLAKQLGITTILLSQLNREVEKRASGRPVLSDLKESGSIEEDADIVMLLSRGSTTAEGFQIINCDIPKNRQGRVGTLTLGFNGAHQRWHETVAPVEFKTPTRRHYTEDV